MICITIYWVWYIISYYYMRYLWRKTFSKWEAIDVLMHLFMSFFIFMPIIWTSLYLMSATEDKKINFKPPKWL